jgi:hypothetical protein
MLSAAKHLVFLIENKQKQILRSAQDDMLGGFFSSLLVDLRFGTGPLESSFPSTFEAKDPSPGPATRDHPLPSGEG